MRFGWRRSVTCSRGSARFWFKLTVPVTFPERGERPDCGGDAGALLLYVAVRRCRYFGNTAPLVMVPLLFPLVTTQTVSRPWLWALPFLFTLVGGVLPMRRDAAAQVVSGLSGDPWRRPCLHDGAAGDC
jgi:hypothetical protein